MTGASTTELHAENKIRKARERLIATSNPKDRAAILKRLRKLKAATKPLPTIQHIPENAFQIRHKWVK